MKNKKRPIIVITEKELIAACERSDRGEPEPESSGDAARRRGASVGYADLVKQEAVILELCWLTASPEQRAAVRRDAPDAIKAMEDCLGRPLKE